MASTTAITLVATVFIIVLSLLILRGFLPSQRTADEKVSSVPKPTVVSKLLSTSLPESVVLPGSSAFTKATNSYWAKQESEVIPACVVRPRTTEELSVAVKILKQEYDKDPRGMFAVRSGGHSPVPNAASIQGGVLIDLSLFNKVILSEDKSSVTIGAGNRWKDVSAVLDKNDLAVVGGRNSNVGVGGLTLGGGLSFFSPQFGLVCSNVISYEIILASGTVTTASELVNSDLWHALKGASNNFGIVTSFRVHAFQSRNVWSGFLYLPNSQSSKVVAAFHEFVGRTDTYDKYTAGPIACFSYVQPLGIQVVSVNLVYTKPEKWPACWKSSGFTSLWRFWSTCKVQSLTSATDEMNNLNPPGRRQLLAATTIKNDLPTLFAAHAIYRDSIEALRGVKGLSWTLVMQPILPEWVRMGSPNPMGLDTD
ncbi:FAD binding domain-containing protein [Rutstroemia sp. NJR-2017a BVV2]|nr:FAD binding domain-containing protein [Rutstroemia sp. NJR-2017a BVV2]